MPSSLAATGCSGGHGPGNWKPETGGKVLAQALATKRDYAAVERRNCRKAIETFGGIDIFGEQRRGQLHQPHGAPVPPAPSTASSILCCRGTYNCTLALGQNLDCPKTERRHTQHRYHLRVDGFRLCGVLPPEPRRAYWRLPARPSVEWAKYGDPCKRHRAGAFPHQEVLETGSSPNSFPIKIDPATVYRSNVPANTKNWANLAAYLVSDFSSYITGEVVTIDGSEWLNGVSEFNWL